MNTGNETVDYLSRIDFVGNVIPNNWFNFIKFDSGKVDINSILILSEIVYWHRPSVIKDENTGKFLGYKKKFKSDKLQKSYESLADQFGLTKRQVKESTDRLQEMNLIKKEFRNIKTEYGQPINNVLYFSLNHLEVERITFESNTDLRSNVTYPTPERNTNTVITTENETDILKYNAQQVALVSQWEKDFDEFWSYYPKKTDRAKAKLKYKSKHKKDGKDAILNGLLMYMKEIAIKNTEKQYIKNPTTFLNAESYLNEFDLTVNEQNNYNIKYQKQDAMSLMLEKFENGGFVNEQRKDEPGSDRILIP